MTIGREQSDFSQGDLVFRGRIRAPTSGRIDHLRHLQDRAEFQRRLDAVEELRKALTRLFALPGATEGTEGYRHPLNNPPAKSDYAFGALQVDSGGPLDFQASDLCPNGPEGYRVSQTGLPDASRIQNIQQNELLERYRGLFERRVPRGLTRSDIGVITEIMDGRGEHDEPHVKVLLANCTEEIWDRDAVTYGGKLNRQKGKVIVKWQGRRPKGVAEHQEWPMFAVTEVGFALVLDPWGNPHCLPPRDAIGDVRYGLQDPDCYYFVAMQTIC